MSSALQSKTKRCYTYTGLEKDGYFYPLHVAAEAGHKTLTVLLVRAGADTLSIDYRCAAAAAAAVSVAALLCCYYYCPYSGHSV